MSLEPRIRAANTADVPVIGQIVEQAYRHYIPRIGKPPGPMLDDYDARVSEGVVWVIGERPSIAGIIVLLPRPEYLLLDNIAVAPARQGSSAAGLCRGGSGAPRLPRDSPLYAPDDDRKSASLCRHRLRGDRARHRGRVRARIHAQTTCRREQQVGRNLNQPDRGERPPNDVRHPTVDASLDDRVGTGDEGGRYSKP